jgi:hypothetical protein
MDARTRYHFADTYGVVIDRRSMRPRIYPATDDGFRGLRPKAWQGRTIPDDLDRGLRDTRAMSASGGSPPLQG